MAELMEKASFIKNKQTSRYLAEKLKFEEKVAKSKAKVKVFEKLEQPTTVLKDTICTKEKCFLWGNKAS